MADINHILYIDSSFDKVFEMISTIDGLKQWWTPDVKGSEKVGELIIFGFGDEGSATFKIEENMPPELLKWKYQGKETDQWFDTEIVFLLSASNDNVKLSFHHKNYKEENDFFDDCDSEWKMYLEKLKAILEE